jgi:hypothetical protein
MRSSASRVGSSGRISQGFGGRFARRRLGAAAGGAEERQLVGEAGEGPALLAFFEHREHLLRAPLRPSASQRVW